MNTLRLLALRPGLTAHLGNDLSIYARPCIILEGRDVEERTLLLYLSQEDLAVLNKLMDEATYEHRNRHPIFGG